MTEIGSNSTVKIGTAVLVALALCSGYISIVRRLDAIEDTMKNGTRDRWTCGMMETYNARTQQLNRWNITMQDWNWKAADARQIQKEVRDSQAQ